MKSRSMINPSENTGGKDQLVEEQLKKLLASKCFKYAKQMQRFLIFIVEKSIAGEDHLLKQYTIGVEALSLPIDFNPDENPSIRIMGGRVRKRLEEYYEKECSNDDEIIIRMKKGSYIPIIEKNTNKKTETKAKAPVPILKDESAPTLALVSITDKTQSKNTNSLLTQLTDSVAVEFSRFMSLQLIVRNPYIDKGHSHLTDLDLNSNSKVDYILALFLQKVEGTLKTYKLIYRLVLEKTGEILWSENFQVSGQPTLYQEYLIGKIIATVGDQRQGIIHNHWALDLLQNKETIPEASRVLVYYRNYLGILDRETFSKGADVCLEAIEKNPHNINAHVIYAEYCRREYVFDYGVIDSPIEKGIKSAESALRLGPNIHEAHSIYGLLLFCQNEWGRSIEELQEARNITKNNIVTEFAYGFQICKMNRWEEGLLLVNKAMSLSKNYPSYYHIVPFLDAYNKGDYQHALYEAKKITTLGLFYGPLTRCISYAQLDRMQEAAIELQEVIKRYPQFFEKGHLLLVRYLGSVELPDKIWDGVLKVTNKLKVA